MVPELVEPVGSPAWCVARLGFVRVALRACSCQGAPARVGNVSRSVPEPVRERPSLPVKRKRLLVPLFS